ncbi:trehalose-phosphatase [Erwinia sp. OLTSP20]|uniref:trehalose-phosphatase n=1 Tax=unclassified Erwinia TaxID=2622719 RepID=UPI000C18263E|nr:MULTISPECIES: trehalose-phosphatase [unclassified Erwinia]PIJ75925.1 trehalose-phosphatase [Erwinia sp. OLSSP12]PIJ83629.1 trehalose-phosphatase [Erwinia sp. OLCASP19]PIJ87485.1 trehalose-phosphatase [Erwinia sp. OLMTSP26]PIJ89033.1 trehalose-phosphatase [Erwinia sp. OLMDSP33]PIJ93843.1 trehalose-phosphatase [Erwinia sp. OLTSP20]
MNQPADGVPVIIPASHAFFFDVDGTLAAIQPQPDDVFIPKKVIAMLRQLAAACDNALALVSGRPLAELDALVAPLRLPLAGVHGAERRDADGVLHTVRLPGQVAASVAGQLQQALKEMPGTLLEVKGMAFALHYRNATHFAGAVQTLAEKMVALYPQLVLQPGKCVVELKPAGVNKGAALRQFMQEVPFAGRTPVFVGDDLTDEAAFAVVNASGGLTIKVADGLTQATHRIADVDGVYAWLEQLTLQLHQDTTSSVRS